MAMVPLLTAKFETGFLKFHSGDRSWRDEPRPVCLSDLNQNSFRELVEYNLHKKILKNLHLTSKHSNLQSAAT